METVFTKRPSHCTSISLPLEMVRYLDSIRNPDISRSRFLFRLIKRALELEVKENQTEVVGPISQMTAHNLQDVACTRKTHRISIGNGEGLYGCEHHGT